MPWFIAYVLPYVAVAVFLLGMVTRTRRWLKTPVPYPLTIQSAGESPGSQMRAVAFELLTFRSLLRGNWVLWLCAWLLHAALAVVLIGHVVGIGTLSRQFCWFGASAATSEWLSATSALVGGLILAAALVALFYRRTSIPDVKRLSVSADFFDILLLLTIVITGLHTRLVTEVDVAAIRGYLIGLMTFQTAPLPSETIFWSHFLLVNLLLIYFPFSKLVHVTGSLVTRALLVQPPPMYPTPTSNASDAASFQE